MQKHFYGVGSAIGCTHNATETSAINVPSVHDLQYKTIIILCMLRLIKSRQFGP